VSASPPTRSATTTAPACCHHPRAVPPATACTATTPPDRPRFIKGAQRLGLRLREVAELLAVHDRGSCPCGHTQALVGRRLGEIDAEIARLAELHGELTRLAAQCTPHACPDPANPWPCEAEFIAAAKEVTGHDAAVP